MITGSHNPKNYNGVKIVFQHRSLSDTQVLYLKSGLSLTTLTQWCRQFKETFDIKDAYLQYVLKDIKLKTSMEGCYR